MVNRINISCFTNVIIGICFCLMGCAIEGDMPRAEKINQAEFLQIEPNLEECITEDKDRLNGVKKLDDIKRVSQVIDKNNCGYRGEDLNQRLLGASCCPTLVHLENGQSLIFKSVDSRLKVELFWPELIAKVENILNADVRPTRLHSYSEIHIDFYDIVNRHQAGSSTLRNFTTHIPSLYYINARDVCRSSEAICGALDSGLLLTVMKNGRKYLKFSRTYAVRSTDEISSFLGWCSVPSPLKSNEEINLDDELIETSLNLRAEAIAVCASALMKQDYPSGINLVANVASE